MDKSKYGVHKTHCCVIHGCKYGDEDCPVVGGEIEQQYTCEYCDFDGIKSIQELKEYKYKENVKIVRCKNCIGILPDGKKKHRCDIFRNFGNPEFFCALGKCKDI